MRAHGFRGFWSWLRATQEATPADRRSPSVLARAFAALGEVDSAFTAINLALEARDSGILDIGVDPTFRVLRSDARYADVLLRLGLSSAPK